MSSKKEAPEPKENETMEGEEGESGGKVKGKNKLKKIIIAVVALILIGAGVFFSGVLGGGKAEKAKTEETAKKKAEKEAKENLKPTYYELPDFLVNLSTGTGKTSFLKMSVTLELTKASSVATVEANKPRILDAFNTYLRELRPTDLAGSSGIYRLREELIARINGTVEQGLVKDILFSEIIVQ